MSTVHCNTVQTSSGGPVTLTKQSAAKTFVAYKSATSTAIYNSQSLNVSSLSDIGTGKTNVNLTNAHSVAVYATSDSGGDGSTGYSTWMSYAEMTASVTRINTGNASFSNADTSYHSHQTYGDLA
jgi:hypothetical protein